MIDYGSIRPLTLRSALFLDLDGTLIDIAPRHDEVRVSPELPAVLARLRNALGGALAIVSGRPLDDIVSLIPIPGICVAAEHGARVRLPDGTLEVHQAALPERPGWIAAINEALPRWPGAFLEEKTIGLVIHYRQAPSDGAGIEAFMRALIAPADGRAELLPALMAFEIRPKGVGKGHAVDRLMKLAPFAGRVPVFIGDDVTDEEGIDAAVAHGGAGLHVARNFGGAAANVRAWLADMADRL
ncbi:trehalose-phosphatase [Acidisoma sp.]|uniref:trehalose-phosphatase n=1 Tax=Acidisoma sp. TaxID=1872115 RepID=UPI003AFF6AF6